MTPEEEIRLRVHISVLHGELKAAYDVLPPKFSGHERYMVATLDAASTENYDHLEALRFEKSKVDAKALHPSRRVA